MPTTATKHTLSGSVSGLGIVVAATNSPGTIIHTATSAANTTDEIWLWAYNGDVANIVLSIEFGGSFLPRKVTIPFQVGLVPVIPGLPLAGGYVVRAYANAGNLLVIDGFVNRVTNG